MLEFTEYADNPGPYGGLPRAARGPELATQQVAIGGTSAQSAAFGPKTGMIVISAISADCRIKDGADPVAANDGTLNRLLRAGSEYAFEVRPGDKLAVIQAAP